MTTKFTLSVTVNSYDDIIRLLRSEADSWERISAMLGDRHDPLIITEPIEAPVYGDDDEPNGEWSLGT